MSLALEQADAFLEDFTWQTLWYVREGGKEVARRFQKAVDSRLQLLCQNGELGRARRFKHPKLQGLRSFPHGVQLQVVRLMDGARDLPNRLAE